MTPSQLAAYESLCAKVPEAMPPELSRSNSAWYLWVDDGNAQVSITDQHAIAILTLHLEAMLPKPWEVSVAERRATYEQSPGGEWQGSDHDRFAAVCAAVEASR